MIDGVHGPGNLPPGISDDTPQRGGGAVEGPRQLRRAVKDHLTPCVIVGVGGERGKRRKQVADALGNFRVAARPDIRFHQRENGGQLVKVAQLRVLSANRQFGKLIARAQLLECGTGLQRRSEILPGIPWRGSVADIALNDRQRPFQALQMIRR